VALAEMAANVPKEKNPSIDMAKDECFYDILERVKA